MKFYLSWSTLVFIFIGIAIFFAFTFSKNTYQGIKREYRLFEVKKKELQAIKEGIEEEILQKEEYAQKIKEPAILIKVTKKKMGYVEPGEIIFKFE